LSFGTDGDEEKEEVRGVTKKKNMARPDCKWTGTVLEHHSFPLSPRSYSVIENPDQPSVPNLNEFSLRPETVVRGEAKHEPVSPNSQIVDSMRCHNTNFMQDVPIVKSKNEDLSKIREAHQREKGAGRYVRFKKFTLIIL